MGLEIFDYLESCIVICDKQNCVVRANANARSHFALNEGDDIRQVFLSEDRVVFFENLKEILESEHLYKNFIRLLDKNRKTQFCYVNAFLNNQNYVFEIIVLSGFSKLGLSQRNINYNYLKYISQGIAHVLRNPIMSISGFLNLIKKKLPSQSRLEVESYMEAIQREFSKIMKIVLDIEIINNSAQLKLELHNIDEFLIETVNNFKNENSQKSINYSFKIECKAKLYIDKQLLSLTVEEILKNAYESVQQAGNIFVSCERQDNNIIITIEDDGGGIEEEKLSMLFTPFYSTKPKNVGLGLFISRLIISAHNGRLRVQSSGNKTIVKIVLPTEKRSKIRLERLKSV